MFKLIYLNLISMSKQTCYGIYAFWICIFSINEIGIIWLWVLFIVMAIDTIMGISKASIFWRYSSKELKKGIKAKLLELLLLLSILIVADLRAKATGEWEQFVWVAFNLLVGLLASAELVSAITSFISFKTWVEYEEQDYVTKILSWVLWVMKKKMDASIPKQDLPPSNI